MTLLRRALRWFMNPYSDSVVLPMRHEFPASPLLLARLETAHKALQPDAIEAAWIASRARKARATGEVIDFRGRK